MHKCMFQIWKMLQKQTKPISFCYFAENLTNVPLPVCITLFFFRHFLLLEKGSRNLTLINKILKTVTMENYKKCKTDC